MRANEILKIIEKENIISSPNVPDFSRKLNKVRNLTLNSATISSMIAPGMTSCVATTFFKVGLCQELAQRFVLEYCIKFKQNNISLIFLSNADQGHKKEDHALVYIGNIIAPDELILGRSNDQMVVNPREVNQKLTDFLSKNREGTFADPLLRCAGNTSEQLAPLMEYCQKYELTHVIGVRSFSSIPSLIENASAIKNNATILVERVKPYINLFSFNSSQDSTTPATNRREESLAARLKNKYNLEDTSQSSLEKGLRNAAANNKVDDVKLFIELVIDIDAKDNNPQIRRTALHHAAIRGHREVCQLLLNANAKTNIPDAHGETADCYLVTMDLSRISLK